jgi:aryl-alcohol dehydrogenase-like predicted oxidoreductase
MAYSEEKLQKARDFGRVADELGVSMALLSIAWVIRNPRVTTAILGASKKEQLEENLKALEVAARLTPDQLKKIADVTQLT